MTGMFCRRAASVAPRMAASSRQPIVQDRGVAGERLIDDRSLFLQAVVVYAGAAAGPAHATAAEQGRGQRRRSGGVADAHLAEDDEIARRNRIVSGCDSGEKLLVAH